VFSHGERVYGVFLVPEEDWCDAPVIVNVALARERKGVRAGEAFGLWDERRSSCAVVSRSHKSAGWGIIVQRPGLSL
jgi:hypothetical protein